MWPSGTGTIPANAQGTTLLADTNGDDHSLAHRQIGSQINQLPTVFGSSPGTNILNPGIKNASDQLFALNSGGTANQIITKGTANNMTMGSQSATGGTFSAPTLAGQGTNNGTFSGGMYGTATFQGGTIGGTPTIQGTVIAGTNITDAAVIERKMKMDILGGTTLTSGSITSAGALAGIPGGSVTINLPIAMNAMIYVSILVSTQSSPAPAYALFVDGNKDAVWQDGVGWNITENAFTAWRTGYAAGNHTWQMQWRNTGAGTTQISGFELVVVPYSQ